MDELNLYRETRGNGARHILFAHGWISSHRMWDDVSARLVGARYTQHLFDFRGCGLSDRPREGHDLESYAGDLRDVLAGIDAPVTLVAHSMGARLAQYVAAERPANLERMILVAPGSARAAPPSAKHRALTLAAYGSRERIERFQRGAMASDVAPEAMRRIVDDALVAQYEHWVGWYERGREVDFRERLA
ncbi:MAG TPA: alpha/beta fold hydrolase, partial [Candidatus Baltobacteraceae bacterium]|nr:alpha/beta fold hydrolase [Candidatus Baltobacteraceae bacterium]